MPFRLKIIAIPFIFLLATLFLQSCTPKPTITGKWSSSSPSNMVFEYRDNGSVWLITDSESRQVWRYEVIGEDTLSIYDGMGRKREYQFTIQGDSMIFADPKTGNWIDQYSRIK